MTVRACEPLTGVLQRTARPLSAAVLATGFAGGACADWKVNGEDAGLRVENN